MIKSAKDIVHYRVLSVVIMAHDEVLDKQKLLDKVLKIYLMNNSFVPAELVGFNTLL